MQNPSQFGTSSLTNQQLASLIELLSKSPQANPASPQFNANYFSQLMNLTPQVMNAAQQQPQVPPPPPREPSFNYLAVKLVDDPKTIQPQEVTMGSRNLFPSSDGEKIFMKTWNTEGLIETETYIRQPKTKSQSRSRKSTAEQKAENDMNLRLSELESSIRTIQKQLTKLFKTEEKHAKTNEMDSPPQTNDDVYDVVDEYEEDSVDE